MSNPPNWPKGAHSLADLSARAGNPEQKYAPLISSIVPATRDGWSTVTVSHSPGEFITFHVPTRNLGERALAAILASVGPLYSPRGATADLYAPEV